MDPNQQPNENEPNPSRGTAVPPRIRIQPLEDRPQERLVEVSEPVDQQPVPAEQPKPEETSVTEPEQEHSEPAPPAFPAFAEEPKLATELVSAAEPAPNIESASTDEPAPVTVPAEEKPVPDAPESWEQNPIATPTPVLLPQDVVLSQPAQPQIIQPTANQLSTPTEVEAVAPAVVSSGESEAVAPPVKKSKNPFKRLPKLAIIAIGIVLLLIIGGLGFYFGFYTNSSLLYKEALSNSGVAYSSLVDYAKSQSSGTASTAATVDGTYSFKSTNVSVDGKINFKGDANNSEIIFDVGFMGNRVNLDTRVLKAPTGDTPDLYVKADGITGFGALLTGSGAAGAKIDVLNGKWVSVDHSFIDSLQKSSPLAMSPMTAMPTKDQIYDEAAAIGNVNKEYLFSTDKTKAVTTVLHKYGMETIDGHKLYHYKVGFVKENVKKFVAAQKDALKASKLESWIMANNYQTQVDESFTQLADSSDKIKPTDYVDVWADLNSRTIYKTRASSDGSAAAKYIEAGFDYKRGDKNFKYFLNGVFAEGNFALKVDLDSVTNVATINVIGLAGSGTSATKIAADFTIKTGNNKIVIEKPVASYTAAQVMALYQAIVAQSEAAANAEANAAESAANNRGVMPKTPTPSTGSNARIQ
ncbi:hypothetical protein H7171_03700 [Candidatus Saccharibacteria bacterium]|nr:hypothetical protein [Candidatus Saccharibacteria bacterium]